MIEQLQWRYAAKAMDPSKSVPADVVERILEATRLAPTSSGLQPFEVVVVTSKAVRERIKPIAWNQGQITDGSHLLVFAAWDNYTVERINHMFDLTNEVRGFKNEGWETTAKCCWPVTPSETLKSISSMLPARPTSAVCRSDGCCL